MKIQAYLTAAAIGYFCASSRKSLREGHNRADRCVELTNSQLLQRPHRTALHGHIAPHGRERAGQACAAVDDEEVRPPQAALDEIVEHGAPLSLIERAALRLPKLALARTRDYRLSTSFGLGLGRRAERTPFSSEFRLYAGSYWNIIRRECAEIFIHFVDENPDIVDY